MDRPDGSTSAIPLRVILTGRFPGHISTRSQARPLSINELAQEESPGTSAQRIALFAYYRDKHEGGPRFTRDDLKGYFAKAKEHPPRNYRSRLRRGGQERVDSRGRC